MSRTRMRMGYRTAAAPTNDSFLPIDAQGIDES
jgi:hypothetical protein